MSPQNMHVTNSTYYHCAIAQQVSILEGLSLNLLKRDFHEEKFFLRVGFQLKNWKKEVWI